MAEGAGIAGDQPADGSQPEAERGQREAEEPEGATQPHAASCGEEERLQQLRQEIEQRSQAIMIQMDDRLANRTLNDFNAEAAKLQKAGEHAAAVATYHVLFAKARQSNLTHPELYVCHSNCAAAYLHLGMHAEALQHADKCQRLAEASLRRNFKGSASYVKSFLRKGQALMGMECNREAAMTLDAGLKMDPFNPDLKQALQQANQGMIKDLAEGKGRETRAIEYPEARQRISYHPYAAPLHRIKTDDMLPLKLLTPFQAENDHHIKDTYNYVTVQTDIKMPKRHLRLLDDSYCNACWQQAIEAAVQAVAAEDKDCRVLNLGAGAGLYAMMALRAGAHHVTAAERWLYLALACKDSMLANKFTEEQFKVVYKRPTDLTLSADVPVCCNLLVANIFDEGLLTSGMLPTVRHALGSLLTTDAILLPASATVYMQAVELRTGEVCGLDMGAANLYRWHPAYAAGVPLAQERIVPLSEPREAWYFDLGNPPDKSDVKTVDIEFTRRGRFNAVMFWYKLHLFGDVYLSTGPEAVAEGLRCLQPAVQYLAGELPVDAGMVLPLVASHNTVRMRFDVESADYLHLAKPDASFPHNHFAMLADEQRCQAYQRAIQRAVKQRRQQDGEAHVLDIGCGTGILSLLAARAGASSVVACDLHESLCDVARKAAAANRLSDRINVVHRDAGLLQRGKEVRPLGVNVVVADVFDAGLLGDGFPYLLDLARKAVVQPGATVVPSAATLYCMGIEALTGQVVGFNMAGMNTYRWDANYEAISLADLPHRRLTKPAKVFEQFFDGERKARGRESMLKLEVVEEGLLNAVVFWFDLHLDDCETLTNAPDGIGEGGVLLSDSNSPSSSDNAAGAEAESEAAEAVDAAASSGITDATERQGSVASGSGSSENSSSGNTRQQPAATTGSCDAEPDDFMPAGSFAGARPGCVFKLGELGLGYYLDGSCQATATASLEEQHDVEASQAAAAAAAASEQAAAGGTAGRDRSAADGTADAKLAAGAAGLTLQEQPVPAAAWSGSEAAPTGSSSSQAAVPGGNAAAGTIEGAAATQQLPLLPPPLPRHHWGQALQYLERAVAVQPGRKLALLARREEGKVRFALRQGVGEYVGRAPWKVEWGGGASVENPHFQRVHYCELLVRDFLQRVRSRRFPPIENDMRMVLAHCGSLLLDPAALQEVYHELVVLEKLHQAPDFSSAASLEALTRRPLRLY